MFSNAESTEQIYSLKKPGSWKQNFAKISFQGAEVWPKFEGIEPDNAFVFMENGNTEGIGTDRWKKWMSGAVDEPEKKGALRVAHTHTIQYNGSALTPEHLEAQRLK